MEAALFRTRMAVLWGVAVAVAVYAVGSRLAAGDFNGHVVLAALGGVLTFLIVGLSVAALRRPSSSPPAPEAEPSRPHAPSAG